MEDQEENDGHRLGDLFASREVEAGEKKDYM